MHREDGSPKDTEKMSAFEVVRSAFTDYLPASPLWSYNSCRIWVKISKQHYHFTLVTSYPINCLRSLSFLSLPHLDNREQKIDLTSILLWLFALFSYKGLRLTWPYMKYSFCILRYENWNWNSIDEIMWHTAHMSEVVYNIIVSLYSNSIRRLTFVFSKTFVHSRCGDWFWDNLQWICIFFY